MYDLTRFTLTDMTRCGIELRRQGTGADSMETAAGRIVRLLYDELRETPANTHACALVRTFVTLPYAELQQTQQEFVRTLLPGAQPRADMKCLTLLATAGDQPEWNSRHTSTGHQALPLASAESIGRSPMISQLIQQLGIEVASLLDERAPMMLDDTQHTFNVFHVPEALGSPYIPAQKEFVEPFSIRSVLGFGGLLVPGQLFATILFSRAPITREVAALFKTLALNVKVALLPFGGVRVFS